VDNYDGVFRVENAESAEKVSEMPEIEISKLSDHWEHSKN
jgi:hypothetical protein